MHNTTTYKWKAYTLLNDQEQLCCITCWADDYISVLVNDENGESLGIIIFNDVDDAIDYKNNLVLSRIGNGNNFYTQFYTSKDGDN